MMHHLPCIAQKTQRQAFVQERWLGWKQQGQWHVSIPGQTALMQEKTGFQEGK